jgi:hypothetical protein
MAFHELRGALAALFAYTGPEVLVEGRAGTAKTTGILTKILYRMERFPGSRHLMVRQTRASLTDSAMVTMDRLLFSTEWDTIYLVEAIDVKSVDAWELFERSLRHGKCDYHQKIADCNPSSPGHWCNRRATKAPDALRDLWHTQEEYDKLQEFNHDQILTKARPMWRMISVHPDNPGYWDTGAWDWTDQGKAFLSRLQSMTGHRRARMLDGRWKAADNVVYPEFTEERHIKDTWPDDWRINPLKVDPQDATLVETLKPEDWKDWADALEGTTWFEFYQRVWESLPDKLPPLDWQNCVGTDPGYDHPTATLWFTAPPAGGTVTIYDEVYMGGRSVKDHGRYIHWRNRGRTIKRYYADPQHAFSMTAQSPESIAMQYKKHANISMTPWPRTGGNEETMVEAVRDKLREATLEVTANCVNTQMEWQTWSYQRNQKGEQTGGEDKYVDADNHAMDVVKGVIATGFGKKKSLIRVSGGVE